MRISEVVSRYGVQQSRDSGLERELASRLHTTDQNHNVIRVEDVVAPCLRQAYFAWVLGHRTLALEIRRVAVRPVVEGLKQLGWDDGRVIVKDLGKFKLVSYVDAFRVIHGSPEAVVVHIGRPNQASTLRAVVVAALTGLRTHLVCISPIDASINATVIECAPEQCQAIAEAAKSLASSLHEALESREPPPPERGSWCARCQYRQVCHALQKIGIKGVVTHA